MAGGAGLRCWSFATWRSRLDRRRRLYVAVATCVATFFVVDGSWAATWHVNAIVPQDPIGCDSTQTYKTIAGVNGCLADGDALVFAGGVYSGLTWWPVYHNVSVSGAGAGSTIISGPRMIVSASATVAVNGMTFTADGAGSGGITNEGVLALTDVSVEGLVLGQDNLMQAPITSWGGPDPAPTTLTLRRTSVTGNTSGYGGGIILGTYTSASIVNSTIAENEGTHSGAILNGGGATLAVVASTITGNTATAPNGAGGIKNQNIVPVTLQNTLIAGNSGPSGTDCQGLFADGAGGHNLLSTLAKCGVNEAGQVRVTGDPTGGTITLVFKGETTAPIPFDATAAQLQAALEALPTIGTGNVYARGGPLNAQNVIYEFVGDLAASDQPSLIVGSVSLIGGTAPTVALYGLGPGGLPPALATITHGVNGDLVGSAAAPIDAVLGSFNDIVKDVKTVPLLAGSPALSAGDASTCQSASVADADARGYPRNAGFRGACDIGAYDTAGTGPTVCDTTPGFTFTPPRTLATANSVFPFEWIALRAHFLRATGSGLELGASSPFLLSYATPTLATPVWFNSATGTPATSYDYAPVPPDGTWLVVQELYRVDPGFTTLLGQEMRVVQATTGTSSAFGFACAWPPAPTPARMPPRKLVEAAVGGARVRVRMLRNDTNKIAPWLTRRVIAFAEPTVGRRPTSMLARLANAP
jgi:hypothetical protein